MVEGKLFWSSPSENGDDVWVFRNGNPRIMSGRERSSIKWNLPCAERVPGLSLGFDGNVRGMSSKSYARYFFADVAE